MEVPSLLWESVIAFRRIIAFTFVEKHNTGAFNALELNKALIKLLYSFRLNGSSSFGLFN